MGHGRIVGPAPPACQAESDAAPSGSVLHAVAFLCLFLSGALGLVYEVAWIRKASLVFGAASFALSTVLAVFFGGLALGSWLFGGFSGRVRRPLRVYGLLEVGIGLLAFASPLSFGAADAVYGWLYPVTYERFALLSALRLAGVSLVLLPPAVLMGGTLPLFVAQYVRSEHRIARSVGLLYAGNTVGAAVGCAVCGFFLLRDVGVDATLRLAATANVAIGAVMVLLPVSGPPPLPAPEPPSGARAEPSAGWVLPALFFAIGAVALSNEVLWTRYLSLLFHNTVHSYTVTLTVMLSGIVVGSLAGAFLFDGLRRRALVFGAVQVATGLVVMAVLLLPPAFWEGRDDPQAVTSQLAVALLVLLLPAVLSGLSFPLAVRMAVRDASGAPRGVGRMAALNTAGGITGSLATGFLVLPALGLSRTLIAVTASSLAIGFTAWLALESGLGRARALLVAAACTGLWLALPGLAGTKLPQDFLAKGRPLLDFREGIGTNLAVVDEDGIKTLEIDRLWQGEDRKNHQIVAAHVPMLLAERPLRVLVIGLGPGQTASRFLHYPIARLDCVEIERELVPLVRAHFDSAWMDDPRVRFVIEDGRNFLTHADERYDVISIEIGQVFRPGLAAFYTEDFYRRARERLEPGGVLAQFLPIGYLTPAQLRTVVRSFLAVFPQSLLWYNKSELLLVGTNAERLRLSEARLAQLESNARVREDLAYSQWGGPRQHLHHRDAFLGGFLLGPTGLAALAGDAETYRDDRPWLEYETSLRGAAAESEIVARLDALAEPVDTLLDAPLDAASRQRVTAMQRANLRDVLASKLVRFSQQVKKGEPGPDVLVLLRKAAEQNPENLFARVNLAEELRLRGQPYAAGDEARRALAIDPTSARARFELAAALAGTGKTAEAVREYEAVLRLAPDAAEAHLGLASLLQARGDVPGAIAHYRAGLAGAPGPARVRLGLLLLANGEREEARTVLEEALALRPDDALARQAVAAALNDEAWGLATTEGGDGARAVALAERAADLSGRQDAAILDTLAAAYAAAGRYDEAMETARAAQERARAAGLDPLAGEIGGRLDAYRAARPWRVSSGMGS